MNKQNRKNQLLKAILAEYIKTAQPVGSKLIVDKYKIQASPATVRNEMAELEQEGMIAQPHTSAGRIPTLRAYGFYLENWFIKKEIAEKERKELDKIIKDQEGRDKIKTLAKGLAELAQGTVFVAFSDNDFFYTGISNLFKQPEFCDLEVVQQISQVVDQMDEVMPDIYKQADKDIKILLGQENPFSVSCASLITKIDGGVVGLLGPMRMDYEKNYSRINYIKQIG